MSRVCREIFHVLFNFLLFVYFVSYAMFSNTSAEVIYQDGEHFYNSLPYGVRGFQDQQPDPEQFYQYQESPILTDISNIKTNYISAYGHLSAIRSQALSNHQPQSQQPITIVSQLKTESGNRKKRKLIQIEEDRSSVCSFGSDGSAGGKKRMRKLHSPEVTKEQRSITNRRERQRTESLNEAFACLRNIIPSLPSDKLSKIQTLKLASSYIEFLRSIISSGSGEGTSSGLDEGKAKDKISHAFSMWRMEEGFNC